VDVDVSGRYDSYSDVGSTANPKYAIDWTVAEGFKLRANYSTSFVAPPVGVLGDPTQGGEYAGGAAIAPAFSVPVSVFPTVTQLPGCAGVTTSCQLGSGTGAPGLTRQYGGALSGVKPQTGSGWNVGADVAPEFLPGFLANVTFFSQEYKGGVTAPNINQITTNSALYQDLILCPGGCSAAQVNAFTRVPEGGTISGTLPSTIYDLQIHDETNVLNLSIQGIDLSIGYDFDTNLGHFHLGDSDTTFTTFNQNILGGPSFSELGTSGINSTFSSIATQNRGTITWNEDAYEVDAWVNYTSGYRNAGNTTVNPIVLDANGNYAGGGDVVKSNTTFDATLAYNFIDGLLGGDQIYVNVINIFDRAPPFYNYPNHGATLSNNGFNPFISSPIGRISSIGFRAKF
jgi:iron complex outermembrane receptor protein